MTGLQLEGKQVLVTGAGGFIGSHLAEELARRGCRVRAFVHYNSGGSCGNLRFVSRDALDSMDIVAGDITDPFTVSKAVKGCEVVFHLAALIAIPYSYIAPQSYLNTNAAGTLHVLQACLEQAVRKVVHTSTSEVYGTALYTPIDECHMLQAQSPYSASKIGADMIAQSYHRSFNLPVATIRPFNTYGPRQSARAVIPAIISQILAGRKHIRLGSLSPIRDLTYVEDTVRGFIQIAEAEASIGEVINIGNGKGISIGDLALRIQSLIGSDAQLVHDESRTRPDMSEVRQLICGNNKAQRLLEWKPRHSLDDGLQHAITFIQQHPEFYKPHIYNV